MNFDQMPGRPESHRDRHDKPKDCLPVPIAIGIDPGVYFHYQMPGHPDSHRDRHDINGTLSPLIPGSITHISGNWKR
jgi:hypothetical protein